MRYKKLFIWVEGENDLRFFDTIIKPRFEKKFNSILVRPYRREKRKKVSDFLRSIKSMNACYIFVADINSAPCVTARKQEIQKEYRNVDEDRIMVVIKEIESWYLAGLDDTNSKKLGVRRLRTTDSVTKEQFNSLMPKRFDFRSDFMLEILKFFSAKIAKKKNGSFRYFAKKHKC